MTLCVCVREISVSGVEQWPLLAGGGACPDTVSVVQEGRCGAFIKLTLPGSQERLTHCG